MEIEDLTFEPVGCTLCGEVATVARFSRPRMAVHEGRQYPVTETFRRCSACGEVVTHTRDHDWRAELRGMVAAATDGRQPARLTGASLLPSGT